MQSYKEEKMAKIGINLTTGALQKEDIIIGIDLGTTNSLVAYVGEDKQAVVINDAGKGSLVPSVIHFSDNNVPEVGEEAKFYLINDSINTIFSVKRLLGRSYKDIESHQQYFSYKIIDDDSDSLVKIKIGNQFYSPIELSAIILQELKKRAEHSLKTPVKRAVITVPAYFNDAQRQATKDAGKLAGLEVLRIVNEPTAASLAYGIGLDQNETKTVVVYDFGGGTFDVSIMQIQNGIFEVLSTNGNTYLGGDDIDRLIIDYWINHNQLKNVDTTTFQKLRLKAEQAKKSLGCQNLYNEKIDDIYLAINRSTFENLITPLVEETLTCCKHALADAKISIECIDEVIMVGGSTKSPYIKKCVGDFFKKIVHDQINPDEVVALGAAIQADILAGNRTDVLLLDVTALSLGIETSGGLMDTIIPRNSKIPTKAGRQYTTAIDGQVNMKISVYQGERDLVSENRKLAEFDLKGIPAMPAGIPKIDINFLLNADGILNVHATELRSGVSQTIEVKPSFGLSDEQIEKMLLDSVSSAKDDIAKRMLIEARNEGEQLSYTAKRFIKRNVTLLTEKEIDKTNELIRDLEQIITQNDKDKILTAVDLLNEYTKPFAERVMDYAISTAMKGKKID